MKVGLRPTIFGCGDIPIACVRPPARNAIPPANPPTAWRNRDAHPKPPPLGTWPRHDANQSDNGPTVDRAQHMKSIEVCLHPHGQARCLRMRTQQSVIVTGVLIQKVRPVSRSVSSPEASAEDLRCLCDTPADAL